MASLLPEIFQATVGQEGPLDAFLSAQKALHTPSELAISRFPEQLDAYTAEPRFVYLLARWMDLDYLFEGPPSAPRFTPGVGRLRALVATAARNGRERGTKSMMIRILETATGCGGFVVETDGAFHFAVSAPGEAVPYRSLVLRIIRAEAPAFSTWELHFVPTERAGNGFGRDGGRAGDQDPAEH